MSAGVWCSRFGDWKSMIFEVPPQPNHPWILGFGRDPWRPPAQFLVWNRATQSRSLQWSLNLSKDGDAKFSLCSQRGIRERPSKVIIHEGNQKPCGDAASSRFGMETPRGCGWKELGSTEVSMNPRGFLRGFLGTRAVAGRQEQAGWDGGGRDGGVERGERPAGVLGCRFCTEIPAGAPGALGVPALLWQEPL